MKIIKSIKKYFSSPVRIFVAIIGFIASLLTALDYLNKWGVVSYFYTKLIWVNSATVSLNLIIFITLILIAIYFLVSLIKKTFSGEEYYLPIKRTFRTGFEPTEYDRREKGYFKNNDKFYFIPLLSHSYASVEFVDYAGPYCAKCHGILTTDTGHNMGRKFYCVNCNKIIKIPKELKGNYSEKILNYLKDKYPRRSF